MESSESEAEFSYAPSDERHRAKVTTEASVALNLPSSDSGVSTSSETSSCEDFPRSEEDSGVPRRSSVALLRNFLPWAQKSSGDVSRRRVDPRTSIDRVGGTTALIQHSRPPDLPAKSPEEDRDHKKQYDAILERARERGVVEERARLDKLRERTKREERLNTDTEIWCATILPAFEHLRGTRRVRELWWRGLPPSVRGRVWKLAIANHLRLDSRHFPISSKKMSDRVDIDESVLAIKLDVSRTLANLGVFQEGGPLHETLGNVLLAYTAHRSDIGYVQGMSYVGAILTLNMEPRDAFVCFANLLDRPCHRAAFTLDQKKMSVYYGVFGSALADKIPKIHSHFHRNGLGPDFYLLDWLYTVYAKAMPLDVACRVWDVFVRDGDEFLFRTALGILRMFQEELLGMDFVGCSQFLTKLPDNLDATLLFDNIDKITTSIGNRTFQDMISQLS